MLPRFYCLINPQRVSIWVLIYETYLLDPDISSVAITRRERYKENCEQGACRQRAVSHFVAQDDPSSLHRWWLRQHVDAFCVNRQSTSAPEWHPRYPEGRLAGGDGAELRARFLERDRPLRPASWAVDLPYYAGRF